MKNELVAQYDDICRALAGMTKVGEVKGIRDKAEAMMIYAQRAKDKKLVSTAAEVRITAETRAGELLIDMAVAGERPKGRRKESHVATLSDLGISKTQSSRWQQLGKMRRDKPSEWERRRNKFVGLAIAACEGDKEIVKAAKAERMAKNRKRRAAREKELTEKILALPEKRYGVVYADPEWRFETYSEAGMDASSADNHYPTSTIENIKQREVNKIAANDCVLFMWTTVPFLEKSFDVINAWGFEYKSHCIWDKLKKDGRGTGYWFIGTHEILIVATRGSVPAPAQGTQWMSVIREAPTAHSVKPLWAYKLIEEYFPLLPKIELNARKRRSGWDSWGTLELEASEAAE